MSTNHTSATEAQFVDENDQPIAGMPVPLPCPFCASGALYLGDQSIPRILLKRSEGWWSAECQHCGMKGGHADNGPIEVARWWNYRRSLNHPRLAAHLAEQRDRVTELLSLIEQLDADEDTPIYTRIAVRMARELEDALDDVTLSKLLVAQEEDDPQQPEEAGRVAAATPNAEERARYREFIRSEGERLGTGAGEA